MAVNAAGAPEQWSIEVAPASRLASRGWGPGTVLPGDQVEITFHPLRSGSHGGRYMSLKLPDGRIMGGGERLTP